MSLLVSPVQNYQPIFTDFEAPETAGSVAFSAPETAGSVAFVGSFGSASSGGSGGSSMNTIG